MQILNLLVNSTNLKKIIKHIGVEKIKMEQ